MIRVLCRGPWADGAKAMLWPMLQALPIRVVGLVNSRSDVIPPAALAHLTIERDFDAALARLAPDMVADCHLFPTATADLAIKAMQAGAHVFVGKALGKQMWPIAHGVAQVAADTGRKLMVRPYPAPSSDMAGADCRSARACAAPNVFRLNLNQRSTGPAWEIHKALMQSTPPIVDCGGALCRCDVPDHRCSTRGSARHGPAPVRMRLRPRCITTGHFSGSVRGWFLAAGMKRAGGPMMSDTAHFVKDVVSPGGAVSLRAPHGVASADVEGHTAADQLIVAPTGQRETRL